MIRLLLMVASVLAAAAGLAVVGWIYSITRDLPSSEELKSYQPAITSRVYAGDGTLVAEFARQHRVFVPYEEIPEQVVHAFISAEDKTFFEHDGIDMKGIFRGTVVNTLRGKRMAGGSTITQQVVKNMLVGNERSAVRKIREMILAPRLQKALAQDKLVAKSKILELYLNEIYLGGRSYGVGAASLNYFGKSLRDLTLSEAAMLAALPKAPGKVNPYKRPEAAKARRDWVIGRMAANGYIPQDVVELARAEPLTTVERLNSEEVQAAAYFVEEVRREILKRAESGELVAHGLEDVHALVADEVAETEIYRRKVMQLNSEGLLNTIATGEELESLKTDISNWRKDGRLLPDEVDSVRATIQRKRADKLLYEEGLSVRATLDSRHQLAAQSALQRGLETYDRRRGFRGALANMEVGDDWQENLSAVDLPRGVKGWSRAVVLSRSATKVSVRLETGEEGVLAEESIEWLADTAKKENGAKLKSGDVITVSPEAPPNALRSPTIEEEPVTEGVYHLRQMPNAEGALVALDPHTGRVLAMAGGYSFSRSQFNRVVQANRQPGSSFKPFVYAAALDSGWTPADVVLDAPFVIETPQGLWKPGNYNETRFYGLSTLRLGIEKSRNLMTARLAQDVGMDKIAEYGRRFGIYPTPDLNATEAERRAMLGPQTYLARSLGAGETTPLKMATAYAMLVNGGKEIRPVILDRIQNRFGSTILRRDGRECLDCNIVWSNQEPPLLEDTRQQVIDPITAYQSVSMMQGVVERGTATRVRTVGKPIAGKTGTTNDYVDAWFVGFSPDLVAAIWIGYDTPVSLGEGESGGRVAAPIFRDFMTEALQEAPNMPFRLPSGVRLVEVDAKTGELPGPATGKIILEAFRPGTEPGGNAEDLEADFRRMLGMANGSMPGVISDDASDTLYDPYGSGEPGIPVEQPSGVDTGSATEPYDPFAPVATDNQPVPQQPVLGNEASEGHLPPSDQADPLNTGDPAYDPLAPPLPEPTPTPEPTPDQDLEYGFH